MDSNRQSSRADEEAWNWRFTYRYDRLHYSCFGNQAYSASQRESGNIGVSYDYEYEFMMGTTLNPRTEDHEAMRGRKRVHRLMFGSLGFLICVLIGIPGVEATVSEFPQKQTDSMENLVLVVQSGGNHESRRDPFMPIKKPRSIASSSKKSRPEPKSPPPIQLAKNPQFMLLGIIHGPFGRQAVIQVLPGKRIFARPGLELAKSGWFIKTISKEEVLLEHFSSTSSRPSLPQPKLFILSFPILGKSQ